MFKENAKKFVPGLFDARVDQAKYSMLIYLFKTLLNGSESLSEKAAKPLLGLILASYFAEVPLKTFDDYPVIEKIHSILKDELPDFSMDISFLTKMTFSIWILSLNQAGQMTMITNQQFWLVLGIISAVSTLNIGIEKREKIIAKIKKCFDKSIEDESTIALLNEVEKNEVVEDAVSIGKNLQKAWSTFWEILRFSALSFALISKIMPYFDDVDATTDLLVRTVSAPLIGSLITLLQKCGVLSMEKSMTLMDYLMGINLEWSTVNSVVSSEGSWGIGVKIAYGLTYIPTLFTAINNTKNETQEKPQNEETLRLEAQPNSF